MMPLHVSFSLCSDIMMIWPSETSTDTFHLFPSKSNNVSYLLST